MSVTCWIIPYDLINIQVITTELKINVPCNLKIIWYGYIDIKIVFSLMNILK